MRPDPLSAEDACRQGQEWSEVRYFKGLLCWLEFDPVAGSSHLMACVGERAPQRLTPVGCGIRSRVHEYGGGAYCLTDSGVVFVRESDQALCLLSLDYRQLDSLTLPLPDADLSIILRQEGHRFGDLVYDPRHRRLLAVEEIHQGNGRPEEVVNRLVAIGLEGQARILHQGADFYASPRVSPDGTRIAWLSWDHPHQPWLSCRLHQARLDGGGTVEAVESLTDGQFGCQPESVFQPEYAPDGSLYFISDRSGWWNLYRWQSDHRQAEPLLPLSMEFGAAQWQLGLKRYGLLDDKTLVCSFIDQGLFGIGVLELDSLRFHPQPQRWATLQSLIPAADSLVAVAGHQQQPAQLLSLRLNAGSSAKPRILAELPPLACCDDLIRVPRHLRFETADGNEAYGFFYPPAQFDGSQAPPLLVQVHGGPTAMANSELDLKKQYWIQRGYALLDLNYRGSTGYGRRYRHGLQEQWGQADLEDACFAAAYCVRQGWVDPQRIYIRGNSAGGYTVLRALSEPPMAQNPGYSGFRAGASHYGISDLVRLDNHTHKFESHYLHWLVGDLRQHQARYRQRSPIFFAERFQRPVIFFQGELDAVVPAEQTRGLYQKLRQRQLPAEFVSFRDERHGFRRAENRVQVLERERAFYEGCSTC